MCPSCWRLPVAEPLPGWRGLKEGLFSMLDKLKRVCRVRTRHEPTETLTSYPPHASTLTFQLTAPLAIPTTERAPRARAAPAAASLARSEAPGRSAGTPPTLPYPRVSGARSLPPRPDSVQALSGPDSAVICHAIHQELSDAASCS